MTTAQIFFAVFFCGISITSGIVLTISNYKGWKILLGMIQGTLVTAVLFLLIFFQCTGTGTYKQDYEQELKKEKDSASYEMVIDTLYRKIKQ